MVHLNGHSTLWTPDKVQLLTELWLKGEVAAEIARQIGGVTRNAVIGKARRIGLPESPRSRKSASERKRQRIALTGEIRLPRRNSPRVPRVLSSNPESITIVSDGPISLLEAKDRHCRSVVGHNGTVAMFCGGQVVEGSSWCPAHLRLYYQPRVPRLRL